VDPDRKRGKVRHFWPMVAAAGIAAGLCGCASSLPSIPNPFADKEEKLPGQRVPVLSNQDMNAPDPSLAGRPAPLPAAGANASWTNPGGNPANSPGHLAFGTTVNKVWSGDAGTGSSWRGRLSAVPLVAGGKVFTLDAGGTVSAFAAAGGGRVWSARITPENEKSAEGFGGGLAMDSGRLYAVTGYGTAVALNPENGAVIWNQRIGEPIRSSPTAAGGKLYFVSTDSVLHALDGAEGQELWRGRGVPQPATLLSNVSPAVGQGIVVAAYPAGDLIAYQAGGGEPVWRESLARSAETTASGILADPARPVIDRGVVFAVSHGGKMIAVAESTGERLWTKSITSTQMPWVAGETVYVVDVAGKLIALARGDGKVRWLTQLPGAALWNGPVLAGSRLWLVSAEGALVGVDASNGQVTGTVDLGEDVFVTPVVAAGRMFIMADDATLIALN
jgi:outer membrane protein assembly factor BamB